MKINNSEITDGVTKIEGMLKETISKCQTKFKESLEKISPQSLKEDPNVPAKMMQDCYTIMEKDIHQNSEKLVQKAFDKEECLKDIVSQLQANIDAIQMEVMRNNFHYNAKTKQFYVKDQEINKAAENISNKIVAAYMQNAKRKRTIQQKKELETAAQEKAKNSEIKKPEFKVESKYFTHFRK